MVCFKFHSGPLLEITGSFENQLTFICKNKVHFLGKPRYLKTNFESRLSPIWCGKGSIIKSFKRKNKHRYFWAF